MSSFGLKATGFVIKQDVDIQKSVLDKFKLSSKFGAGTSLDPNKAIGQLVLPITAELASVWELGQAVYNSLNPDNAEGESLDIVCALIGVTRKGATQTKVEDVKLYGTYGTVINTGAIVSCNINQEDFILDASVTIGPSGYGIGDFTAINTGAIECQAGTLTIIRSPTSGWTSTSNPFDGEIGTEIETDAELRLRRLQSLQISSKSTIGGIYSNILQAVAGVVNHKVIENDGDVADAEGRPGHSVECIVKGGLDQDIFDKLIEVKGGGIKTTATGSDQVSGTALDMQGDSHPLMFSRPTETNLYFHVELEVDKDNFNVGSKQKEKVLIKNNTELTYGVIINGESRSIPNAGLTKPQIAAALTVAINSGLWLPVVAVWNGIDDFFTIESEYNGNVFTLSALDDDDIGLTNLVVNTGDQILMEANVLAYALVNQIIGERFILTKYFTPVNNSNANIWGIIIRASETRWVGSPSGSTSNIDAAGAELFELDSTRVTIEVTN